MVRSYSDPVSAMLALQRELENRFASDWMGGGTAAMGSYPPVNMFQQNDDFVAVIELPGISKDDLTIEAKESTLRISGKKEAHYDREASVHRRERVFGSFDRTISLPVRIDADQIRAEYRNGMLALFIPRAASEKPRTIQID